MEDSQPKTLYVGNLDSSVAEDLLIALFSQIGSVQSCKIIREANNDPYAFIEFADYSSACTALSAMNKRNFLNKEIKVNWATSPGNQPKTDISSHYHIFVGDLSPEIETETLREAFAPFGEISNCRIVKDPQTLKSRGYAFVSFVKKAEAENAIHSMNGQWIGSRAIRTNWSTRKLPLPRDSNKSGAIPQGSGNGVKNKSRNTIEDIFNQSSPTNTTVYCGGFPPNVISEELIQQHFGQFGPIADIRVFKDKGYAFIKFIAKESAAHAIEKTHLSEVNGNHVKCFWGKENGGESSMNNVMANANASMAAVVAAAGLPSHMLTPQQLAAATSAALPTQLVSQQQIATGGQYPYAAATYQQMGFWYPQTNFQGYPATQMQAPYMPQGYYPYTTYATQQPGAMPGYRMVQPNIAWGVPGAVMPSVGAPTTSAPNVSNGITPQILYNAGMQQYPTQ